MSFRCQSCARVMPPKIKAIKVVTDKRHVVYELVNGRMIPGTETVKELTIGPCCKTKFEV